MKRLLYFFLFATLLGCGVASSLQGSSISNNWYPVDMKPSEYKIDGSIIYTSKLNNANNEYVEVYYDSSLQKDATYYYNELWSSYGWSRHGDDFSCTGCSSNPKVSTLHISVKRGVAIYLDETGKFSLFRVEKKQY
tara:strand:- start:4080 stop:4487 length:408 start_codon:yes stop_codon:yes gene_type:complete